ncbi:hypothetical protein GCM10010967_44770 [Dyadobacter beijingensis]|uniref:Aerotolerance regulator N-terminal domain-containing protein n=1 Tax=Dyadobacter beijingensis TaxID=365489 RepID=A0ABQ2I9S1_9BACT|nr:BatA domain-containing protein [Dyadobacter beijingensis]GGN04797.1 hypothetical protein GCM10010967_44770 [Dyadobacter beijingensis]
MTFLQSYWLWGMLAVAVPVAIHFWYQKRGKTIEWAAMRWLGEQTTLQHRGFRLNEVALMLVRCLVVALLALVLSKPVVHWLKSANRLRVVHIVQGDRLVTEAWRFELNGAMQKGEPVYWLGASPQKTTDLIETPAQIAEWADLQTDINALASENGTVFKLYFHSSLVPEDAPRIYVPGNYELFPVPDTTGRAGFDLSENRPVFKNNIHILLDYPKAEEHKTVAAALAALHEVHGFPFEIENNATPGKHYDWVFTNKPVKQAKAATQYVVSGVAPEWGAPASVIFLPDSLQSADDELVESGRLPEWLGELMLKKARLDHDITALTNSQLNALFEKAGVDTGRKGAALRPWLLLVFLGLLITERWLALRKPVAHG